MATNKKSASSTDQSVSVETKSYTVLTPVLHNGESFGPGDSIDLDSVTADPLLAVAAIAVAT